MWRSFALVADRMRSARNVDDIKDRCCMMQPLHYNR